MFIMGRGEEEKKIGINQKGESFQIPLSGYNY